MEIIDLVSDYNKTYFSCLEDWNGEMQEGVDCKCNWFENMKDRGLRVKLAKNDEGDICGMIQYVPSEHSFLADPGYYVVLCLWVHGYKEGVGNYQKQGIGTRLITEAEKDSKSLGAKGLVTWGISLPLFMRATWFKKHGYEKIDSRKGTVLLWKPFMRNLEPPKRVKRKKDLPIRADKVSIAAFVNGWCTGKNLTFERVRKAALEFEEYVDFKIYDTTDRAVVDEWGIFDNVFIDGEAVRKGKPLSYKKAYALIEAKVKKN